MKKCTQCNEEKEPSAFHKKKAATDGLSSWCITCKRAKSASRHKAKRSEMTEDDLKMRAIKKAAHGKVDRAVARGELVKPSTCPTCAEVTASINMHAHHHNGYDDPLDIEWVCHKCHLLDHGEARTCSCETCGASFKRQRKERGRFCSAVCWHASGGIGLKLGDLNIPAPQLPKRQPDTRN